jgi:hypothetical protein
MHAPDGVASTQVEIEAMGIGVDSCRFASGDEVREKQTSRPAVDAPDAVSDPLLGIRACHGSRQRIGDSRAVGRRRSSGVKFFPQGGAACAPGRWRDQFSTLRGGGGVDEVGFGSAAPAGVAGGDCIDLCRSQFDL